MENKRFLIITKDFVRLNPTQQDEIKNPGAVIINYSYFDKFFDDYFYLMPKKFVQEIIKNDFRDIYLYNHYELVERFIINILIKISDGNVCV